MSGISWAFLSALFAGLTAVLAKLGVKDISSDLAMALRTTVVVVAAWALALVRREAHGLTAIPGRTLLFLGLSGLATGASWLCYFRALSLAPVSKVAPIDKLSFVIATGLALLFLRGEKLTWPLAAGCVLIVVGVLLTLKG